MQMLYGSLWRLHGRVNGDNDARGTHWLWPFVDHTMGPAMPRLPPKWMFNDVSMVLVCRTKAHGGSRKLISWWSWTMPCADYARTMHERWRKSSHMSTKPCAHTAIYTFTHTCIYIYIYIYIYFCFFFCCKYFVVQLNSSWAKCTDAIGSLQD